MVGDPAEDLSGEAHADIVAGLKNQLGQVMAERERLISELASTQTYVQKLMNEREAIIAAVLAMARLCAKIMDDRK